MNNKQKLLLGVIIIGIIGISLGLFALFANIGGVSIIKMHSNLEDFKFQNHWAQPGTGVGTGTGTTHPVSSFIGNGISNNVNTGNGNNAISQFQEINKLTKILSTRIDGAFISGILAIVMSVGFIGAGVGIYFSNMVTISPLKVFLPFAIIGGLIIVSGAIGATFAKQLTDTEWWGMFNSQFQLHNIDIFKYILKA